MALVPIGVAACGSGKAGTKISSKPTTSKPKTTTKTTSTTLPAKLTTPLPSATNPTTTPPPATKPAPKPAPAPAPAPNQPAHIMVVMMENKNLSEVTGQSDQPYTNSLASSNGLATESYGFGHPSLPNYLDIVSGSNKGVTDDNPPSAHSFPNIPTLADQLAAAGISEIAFAEDLPADPTNDSGEYAVRHFPWEYFPNSKMPIANATSLVPDLNTATPPSFVWYTPNLIDDEHDGTVEQGDAFLSRFIPQVQATNWYKAGGQIIITWDESDADNTAINGGQNGGGHIPTIVISNVLKIHPQQDATPVDTVGVLRSIEDAYGLPHLGDAANAANGSIDSLLNGS
jgi:hypothetical protein